MKKIYITFSLIVWALPSLAQKEMKLLAYRNQGLVILRWAPANGKEWRHGNAVGYNVYRAEQGTSKFEQLNRDVLKPITSAAGTSYKQDEIVSQAVQLANSPTAPADSATKDDVTFGFYFMVASQSSSAAMLTASGYIDSTALAGKQYTYRVSLADGSVSKEVSVANNTILPASPRITVEFGNKSAKVKWNMKDAYKDYFAAVVEVGTDSNHMSPIASPSLKLWGAQGNAARYLQEQPLDSLVNGLRYYIRIRGLNAFGVAGPTSNIVSGYPSPDLLDKPRIKNFATQNNGTMSVTWQIPDSALQSILRFEVYQSRKPNGDLNRVWQGKSNKDTLANFRTVTNPSNYFYVVAIGLRDSQTTISYPYFYQPPDHEPPAAPIGLKGVADTNGVVTITWARNKETDLAGYRVLKSQDTMQEFIITSTADTANVWHDTVDLRLLNTKMLYCVLALDKRNNYSKRSKILTVKLPDRNPPAAPFIDTIAVVKDHLKVRWVKSFSEDVVGYEIYRKLETDTSFTKLATLNDTNYEDKATEPDVVYYYGIKAKDEAGHLSNLSPIYPAIVPQSSKPKTGVKNFNSYVSSQYNYIELGWAIAEKDVVSLELYRGKTAEDIALLATLPADSKRYVDERIEKSNNYHYGIRVMYKDGRYSKLQMLEAYYQ